MKQASSCASTTVIDKSDVNNTDRLNQQLFIMMAYCFVAVVGSINDVMSGDWVTVGFFFPLILPAPSKLEFHPAGGKNLSGVPHTPVRSKYHNRSNRCDLVVFGNGRER